MDLGDFLLAQGGKRRVSGEHDCCTFPAAWAFANEWTDPMSRWRGAYASEDEAQAFINDAGGLSELFARGMADAGIPSADLPYQEGDIGIVRIGDEEAGAIFTGRRWAFVTTRGLGMASVDEHAIAAAWRVRRG